MQLVIRKREHFKARNVEFVVGMLLELRVLFT